MGTFYLPLKRLPQICPQFHEQLGDWSKLLQSHFSICRRNRASVDFESIVGVIKATVIETVKHISRKLNKMWNSLILRIFWKWQRSRLGGSCHGFFCLHLINCLINWFMTSTVAAKFAEFLQGWNVVFWEEDRWAKVLFSILLIPRIICRIIRWHHVFCLCSTWGHFVKAIRELTERKNKQKKDN